MKERFRKRVHKFFYYLLRSISFFLLRILAGFRIQIKGREEIPEDRDLLVVAPHTSYWDPPLIAGALGRRGEIHFVAGKSLLSNPVFYVPVRFFTTTVDREDFGKEDYRNLLEAFDLHRIVGILPEGTIQEGVEAKRGAVRLVEGTERFFLPVSIEYYRYRFPFDFLFKKVKIVFRKPFSYEKLEEKAAVEPGEDDYYRLLTETLMEETKS